MPFDLATETPALRRATLIAALRDELPKGADRLEVLG